MIDADQNSKEQRSKSGRSGKVAGEPGFEPGLTESESVGLPLTYSPAVLWCALFIPRTACFAQCWAIATSGKVGWGTWIRTRTDGVRVRRSTVNLFPNKTWSAATRDASWRGPLCIKPARVWQPLFCFDLFNHAITAYGICLVGDCRYTHIADSRDRHINVLMIRDTDSAINRKQVFER